MKQHVKVHCYGTQPRRDRPDRPARADVARAQAARPGQCPSSIRVSIRVASDSVSESVSESHPVQGADSDTGRSFGARARARETAKPRNELVTQPDGPSD